MSQTKIIPSIPEHTSSFILQGIPDNSNMFTTFTINDIPLVPGHPITTVKIGLKPLPGATPIVKKIQVHICQEKGKNASTIHSHQQ